MELSDLERDVFKRSPAIRYVARGSDPLRSAGDASDG